MPGLSELEEKDESSHSYIAYLCADAAHGIDFMTRGKESEYKKYVPALAELMDKYSKKCTSEESFNWPYFTFLRVLEHNKVKKIKNYSELSLEMKLFANELKDIANLHKEKQKELLKFCCLTSQYFIAQSDTGLRYLAA